MQRITVLLIALLVAAPGLSAQRKCYTCKGEGWIPCKKKDHDQKRQCRISIEHKCDLIYEAPCCRGVQKIFCTRCNDPVVEAEINEALQRRIDWVKRQKEFLKPTGSRMCTVVTKNCILHFSPRRWKTKERTLPRDRAAHLFADRLQTAADRFLEVTGVLPTGLQRMVVNADRREQMAYTLHKMGGGHETGFKSYSVAGTASQWPDTFQGGLDTDEGMHAYTVHNFTHLLSQASIRFVPDLKFAAWLDTGLAHWIEEDQCDETRTFCFQEVQGKSSWDQTDWKRKLYFEVKAKREVKFATLIAMELDKMNHRDHAHAWSFVDFLIKRHPEKFKEFFQEMKRQNDTKKVLDKIFNWSTSSVHDLWRKFVLREYAPK